jgi:hypothetical protein
MMVVPEGRVQAAGGAVAHRRGGWSQATTRRFTTPSHSRARLTSTWLASSTACSMGVRCDRDAVPATATHRIGPSPCRRRQTRRNTESCRSSHPRRGCCAARARLKAGRAGPHLASSGDCVGESPAPRIGLGVGYSRPDTPGRRGFPSVGNCRRRWIRTLASGTLDEARRVRRHAGLQCRTAQSQWSHACHSVSTLGENTRPYGND